MPAIGNGIDETNLPVLPGRRPPSPRPGFGAEASSVLGLRHTRVLRRRNAWRFSIRLSLSGLTRNCGRSARIAIRNRTDTKKRLAHGARGRRREADRRAKDLPLSLSVFARTAKLTGLRSRSGYRLQSRKSVTIRMTPPSAHCVGPAAFRKQRPAQARGCASRELASLDAEWLVPGPV